MQKYRKRVYKGLLAQDDAILWFSFSLDGLPFLEVVNDSLARPFDVKEIKWVMGDESYGLQQST